MYEIYRGILLSDHTDLMKKTLVDRVVLPAADTIDVSSDAIGSIFEIALQTAALAADRQHRIELGCVVFETWASRHVLRVRRFLTAEILRNYLTEEVNADLSIVLRLAAFVFALKDDVDNDDDDSAFGAQQAKVILDEAPRLLDRDDNLTLAAPLVRLLLALDDDLPALDRASFVRKLIRCMARCRPADRSQLLALIKNAEVVAAFTRTLLTLGDREAVDHCFGEIFLVLSAPVNGTEPCSCLAAILSVFPFQFLEAASKTAVLDVRFDDGVLETILRRLLEWLVWPGARNLDAIINHYMCLLKSLDRQLLLIQVTQQVMSKLFMFLRSTVWCESVLPVLLKMLLSYLHSSDVFHSILPSVPFVLKCLLNRQPQDEGGGGGDCDEGDIGDRHESAVCAAYVADQVIALVYTLVEFFPGFPEIYDPVMAELQNFPKPDPQKVSAMRDFALKNKWTCEGRSLVASVASSSALQAKSSTGKVGLCNLGQSCYANSILQALYMNDEFRNKVLLEMSRLPAPLFDLQNVFAFLTHSQRAAYSPEAFLRVSRPPWFLEGNQQDCSEYLRYFLDQLHEQQEANRTADADSNVANISLAVCEFHTTASTVAGVEGPRMDSKKLCLIHDLFGGQLSISYQCFNCLQMSRQIETFIDLSLALNHEEYDGGGCEALRAALGSADDAAVDAAAAAASSSSARRDANLKLEDLLQFYLTPEKLEGDNRYHCTNCDQLRVAQKTTCITKAPKYLILTLLRFSYDPKTHQRTKILKNVDYPEVLRLPVHPVTTTAAAATTDNGSVDVEGDVQSNSNGGCSTELYSLYAVVMHSGTSSDCGHYYTYACHSKTLPELFCHDKDVVKNVEERSWYLFNDSRVTYSQYKSFCNNNGGGGNSKQQHFGRDTAYLLFYRKITTVEVESTADSVSISEHDPKALGLHGDLYEAVHRDNQSYLKELEDEAMREEQRKKSAQRDSIWRDFDDRNPPGNCGGGGGSGGGLGTSARFVC